MEVRNITLALVISLDSHVFPQESRLLTTVPLLEVCLPPEKLVIRRGRRFYENSWPDLHKLLNKPTTLLLYPGPTGLSILI